MFSIVRMRTSALLITATVFAPDVLSTSSLMPIIDILGVVLRGSAVVTTLKPCLAVPHSTVLFTTVLW